MAEVDIEQKDETAGNMLTQDWSIGPERVRIWEDEFHVLHIEAGDTVYDDVHARCVFPISGKSDWVSFLADKDNEVVLLRNPDGLEPESRAVLRRALDRLYFAARIRRVDDVIEAMGVSLWHVLTDQGYARFEVVDRQRHIRILPGGRFIITDADGNRFEIENLYELDERSRQFIETET